MHPNEGKDTGRDVIMCLSDGQELCHPRAHFPRHLASVP